VVSLARNTLVNLPGMGWSICSGIGGQPFPEYPGQYQRNIHLGFKSKRNEVIPVALTKEELIRITKKKFDIERLDHVRDIFIFSCYTGLAYIDAYKLRNTDIVIGIDGGI
jgi:hypothetical protein